MFQRENLEDRLGILLIESDSETILTIRLAFAEIKECILHVVSSCKEALEHPPECYPDLILLAHDAETSDSEQLELFQRYPSAYILCSLPFQDDDLVDRYIKAGANRIIIKNDSYISDLIDAVKKALILIMERKSFLMASLSDSSTDEEESLSDLLAGTLKPAETILHYRILEEIGEGGMGEIYLAEDLKLGRQVAIKVLPPKIARNHKMKQRLAFEARAASALNHPNIVTRIFSSWSLLLPLWSELG